MSEVNTTVEQVEQNEMEEYLSPIDYDFIDHETQFHIQEIYNKLKAEKEELESQVEFFKKECDRFGDEAIDLEIYKEHSVNLEDLTPEERQQVKDYAQKLRDERIQTECWYEVENQGGGLVCMWLCSMKFWHSSKIARGSGKRGYKFNSFKINKRLYTADEKEKGE